MQQQGGLCGDAASREFYPRLRGLWVPLCHPAPNYNREERNRLVQYTYTGAREIACNCNSPCDAREQCNQSRSAKPLDNPADLFRKAMGIEAAGRLRLQDVKFRAQATGGNVRVAICPIKTNVSRECRKSDVVAQPFAARRPT